MEKRCGEKQKQRKSRIVSFLVAGLFTLLSGCASQGPLRPPSLHLAAPVRGLRADRVSDSVTLNWTAPSRTTDGLPLDGKHVPRPLTVQICREQGSAPTCLPGGVSVEPGQTGRFRESLPLALITGPARLLTYRVRVLNGQGKGAAPSSAQTLAGTAPLPLQGVVAAPVQAGVLIRWQPDPAPAGERVQLRVRRGTGTSQKGAEQDVLLAVEPSSRDSGGALDPGAKPGVAQRYSIARTRSTRLGGIELSMSSAPVTVEVGADARAPALSPPTGLETVSNSLAAPEIDLVWQPSAGAAGYRIYRAEADGPPQLLTPEPVHGLSYADTAVRPGNHYRFSVSAVGSDGREGARSKEATEQVPAR